MERGVLSRTELDQPGCACRAVGGTGPCEQTGTNPTTFELSELWTCFVVRTHRDMTAIAWSAAEAERSRGYGKEENARSLMKSTRANRWETFCAVCELILGPGRSCNIRLRKDLRLRMRISQSVVEGEVRRILEAHFADWLV